MQPQGTIVFSQPVSTLQKRILQALALRLKSAENI
jgi:hypothetical protein